MSILDIIRKPNYPQLSISEERGKLVEKKSAIPQVSIPKLQPIIKPKVGVIDFLKEIPTSTVKVISSIAKFGKGVQEDIAKSGASVAMTAMYPFTKKETLISEELDPDLRKAKEFIFGKDPLKSLQTRIAETELTLKEKGLELPGVGKIEVKGKELPLAILGVGAVVGLDFTGWGGGKKQAVNLLTKINKVDDVAKVLKQINVADDLIPVYSKTIAKLTKADDVAKALDKIVDIQKTTKLATPIAQKAIKEAISAEKGIIPTAKGVKEVIEELPKLKERAFLQSVSQARPDVPLKVGGQYIPRSTDDLAIKAKNLIKTDINIAENLARTGTDEKAVATASELIKHYSDEAAKTTSQAVKNALYEKASEIAHITAGNLTEQGRSVQAASILGRLTPEGMLRFAAKEINKYNEAIEKSKGLLGLKKKIPQLTTGQTEMILGEFKKIEAMTDGTEKAMAFKKLNDAISDLIPSSMYKKIINVWKAGLLTGIKTSGLNTFSNLFHGVSETIKDIPAVAIDSVASLFSGERTVGLVLKPKAGAVQEGFQKGWRYLATGFDERNVAIKLDWRRVSFGQSKLAK